jgi:hypothetical protein
MSDQSVDDPDDFGGDGDLSEPSAATITLSLPPGIYAFKVKSGGAALRDPSIMALPAVKIDLAPIEQEARVDFLAAPTTCNNYLAYEDDVVVARIAGAAALFMLVSLRMPDQEALALDIARLDIPSEPGESVNEVLEFDPDWTLAPDGADDDGRVLPATIAIYLPTGDRLEFEGGWACGIDDVQWIEAFTIAPADGDAADLLEYGAITEGQTSSDWRRAGELCGIPGSNVALQGFAVRTKPGAEALYDCCYFGVFGSGAVVGPLSDGVLCVSDAPDDPLVRMDVRLVERLTGQPTVAGMRRL